MSLTVLYEAGIAATSEDITDRIRKYTMDITQDAEEGSVALSSLTIDDPAGNYDVKGWRRIRIYDNETSIGSNSLIANLWVADRRIERGPYRTGAGRQWVCSVADMNSVGEFRVLSQASANRPAESDVTRIQWLMTTNELGDRVTVSTYIDTSTPVAMDAVDYRGQRPADVINDCAQQSGKNHFIYTIDGVSLTLGLWYAQASSTLYSSNVRLTNVLADVAADPYGLTLAIGNDTVLERDPSRVYSGAFVQFDGGTALVEDLAISANFTRRDAIVPAPNVKTNAKATARGTRYLTDFGTEEDRITTSFRVPNAKVNFVKEGMRLQIKATHLPGYTTYTWARVLKRAVKQDSEESYLVTLDLTVAPVATCAGNPTLLQQNTGVGAANPLSVTLNSAPTPGNMLVAFVICRDSVDSVDAATGWTAVPNANGIDVSEFNGGFLYAFYRVVQAGDGTSYSFPQGSVLTQFTVMEWCGLTTLDASTTKAKTAFSTTPSVGPASLSTSVGVAIGAIMSAGTGPLGGTSQPDMAVTGSYTQAWYSDVTNDVLWNDGNGAGPTYIVGYKILSASGNTTMTGSNAGGTFAVGDYGGILMVFR